ncbi:MAG: ABC transporter substrate-binding protein [Chloroflexi bacterium]|nr:ABC transporter substrate-binding protein [Chloroflexota bacterium]
MNNRKWSRLGRRDFVKMLGLGTGAMMVNPSLQFPDRVLAQTVSNSLPSTPTTLKIGLLLPSSNIRPGMTTQLMNGMQLYFDQVKSDFGRVQLIPESIGLGSTVALRKATQLLKEADVDLVIGMVSTPTALRLQPLFEAEQKVLLVVGAGETMPRSHESSPYIFHATLNYWQSNWAAGRWAAQHKGNRAFMISSFYESGYDSFYAFQSGFESAGGTIIGRAVTHISPDNDGMPDAMAALQAAQPDVVFAAYNGEPTHDFLRYFADLAPNSTLMGTAFMLDDRAMAPVDMYFGTSWLIDLDNAQNTAFSTDYRRLVGHTPDAFASLGYETAQMLTQSIQSGGVLAHQLPAVHINGPRGNLTIQHQSLVGPTYLASIHAGQASILTHFPTLITELAHTTEPRSGWLNPYLV